jgi:hypothetical protein
LALRGVGWGGLESRDGAALVRARGGACFALRCFALLFAEPCSASAAQGVTRSTARAPPPRPIPRPQALLAEVREKGAAVPEVSWCTPGEDGAREALLVRGGEGGGRGPAPSHPVSSHGRRGGGLKA